MLILARLYRKPLRRFVEAIAPSARLLAATVAPRALVPGPAVQSLVWAGMAMKTLYDQQYQMHRFAVDVLKVPVAVNDFGWVAYGNDNYVLDLWGLANETARVARLTHSPGWMNRLTLAHGVHVAMIFPSWFQDDLPAEWVPVVRLVRARPPLSGDTTVNPSFSMRRVPMWFRN